LALLKKLIYAFTPFFQKKISGLLIYGIAIKWVSRIDRITAILYATHVVDPGDTNFVVTCSIKSYCG